MSSTAAPSPAATAAPAPTARSFIETADGQRLFYRDYGAGQPVVFIHGWTLSSEIWRDQLDWLASQGLRAIAYDRRGHGQSSKPDSGYAYDMLASDLARVIDQLDLRDITLVGHSMGAGEAVRYLTRTGGQRIARLLLVAPTTPFPLKTEDNPLGVDRAMYDAAVAALQADRPAYMKAGTANFVGPHPDPELLDWAMTIALQASLPAEIQCLRSFSETDFRREVEALTLPTLILYGTGDAPIAPVNARRTHEAIAGSRLEVYDGAPHALFLTDTERFNRDLLRFAQS